MSQIETKLKKQLDVESVYNIIEYHYYISTVLQRRVRSNKKIKITITKIRQNKQTEKTHMKHPRLNN